nr:TDT family transporter [uncultured Niameybacter sp.]
MKAFLKKTPMPIVGLMLACAALGNLVQSYGEMYRNIMGAIALILFIGATVKFACDMPGLKNELDNPVAASVFPTYSMGIMLLATYIKPYSPNVAYVVWSVGILLHITLIIIFSMKYIRNFSMKKVFPSWFIVYVGIAVAAVTGKAFNQTVGQVAFLFAVIAYLVLLFVISKRVLIVKEIPEPALPTLVIFAAPGSLCLAGYLNSFDNKNFIVFILLLVVSQGFYIFALSKLVNLLKLKFYPSYSAFTFPLVISALALKLSNGFLVNQGITISILPMLIKVEELIAILIVFYVLIRYITNLVKD